MAETCELNERAMLRRADRAAAHALEELAQVPDRELPRILAFHVLRLYERAAWGHDEALEALRDALRQLEEDTPRPASARRRGDFKTDDVEEPV